MERGRGRTGGGGGGGGVQAGGGVREKWRGSQEVGAADRPRAGVRAKARDAAYSGADDPPPLPLAALFLLTSAGVAARE